MRDFGNLKHPFYKNLIGGRKLFLLSLKILRSPHILYLGSIKHKRKLPLDFDPLSALYHAILTVDGNIDVVLVSVVILEELYGNILVEIILISPRLFAGKLVFLFVYTAKPSVLRLFFGKPLLIFSLERRYRLVKFLHIFIVSLLGGCGKLRNPFLYMSVSNRL